jgi:hypothetical protein
MSTLNGSSKNSKMDLLSVPFKKILVPEDNMQHCGLLLATLEKVICDVRRRYTYVVLITKVNRNPFVDEQYHVWRTRDYERRHNKPHELAWYFRHRIPC